jgi:hypothetical protein
MTEPKPTYNTDPTAPEHQTAAQIYMAYKAAHEFGLALQRQLESMDALPSNQRLFLTRAERRHPPPE